jgi:hypothetical protein
MRRGGGKTPGAAENGAVYLLWQPPVQGRLARWACPHYGLFLRRLSICAPRYCAARA